MGNLYLSSLSRLFRAYIILKVCIIVSSTISAWLIISSAVWPANTEMRYFPLHHSQSIGSTAFGSVSVVSACLSFILLVGYVCFVKPMSISAKILMMTCNLFVSFLLFGFCIGWTVGFIVIYSNTTFTDSSIFDSYTYHHGLYILAMFLGVLTGALWFGDAFVASRYRIRLIESTKSDITSTQSKDPSSRASGSHGVDDPPPYEGTGTPHDHPPMEIRELTGGCNINPTAPSKVELTTVSSTLSYATPTSSIPALRSHLSPGYRTQAYHPPPERRRASN